MILIIGNALGITKKENSVLKFSFLWCHQIFFQAFKWVPLPLNMRQKYLQGTFSVLFSFSTYELLPSVVKRFCGAKLLNIRRLKSLAKPQNYAKAPDFFEVQQIIIFIFCYTERFFQL